MPFVAEFERETPGIEMRSAFAVLVHEPAIGEFRPVLLVEFRRLFESEQIQDRRKEIVWVRRAAGNVDDRLAREDSAWRSAGRIGIGRLDAAPGRARADRDDGGGAFGGLAHLLHLGLAADLAMIPSSFAASRPR